MFDLSKALASARPGDAVRVPAGDYGDVRLSAKFAEMVTLTPEDPANPPRFRSIILIGCVGLALDGLAIDWRPTAATLEAEGGLSVRGCSKVDIRNMSIRGYPAPAGISPDTARDAPRTSSMVLGWPAGRGVYIEASTDVLMEAAEVTGFHRGVVIYKGEGIAIRRNDIHHNRATTIMANGLRRALIEANHLHSSQPWNYGGNGDHGDFIAIQFANQTATNADIQIIDNLLDQGDGDPIMGIMVGGQPGTEGLVIADNLILGGHTQAILLNQILSGEVVRNVARRIGGEAKTSPGLLTRDLPAKFRIVDNALGSAVVGPGTKNIAASDGNAFDQSEASHEEITARREAWLTKYRPGRAAPERGPVEPARDELREIIAARTGAKLEPLKTKGRLIIDFKTPAQGQAALAAVSAIVV